MCELFGFSSQHCRNISNELKEFFSHCVEHPNGWGLARVSGASVSIHTEPVTASDSGLLPKLLEDNAASQTVLAHIRRATVGGVNLKNCHPFVRTDNMGRMWLLIHNGTIFSGMKLIRYQTKQDGDTDSERILLYLVDQIDEQAARKGCELNSFERFKVVERVIAELSYRNKLNLIIYDGQQMYVHVNMKDTLFIKTGENTVMFATVPLDEQGWEGLPLTTLFVYQEGKLVYRGKNHHNEYIDMTNTVAQQYDYNI